MNKNTVTTQKHKQSPVQLTAEGSGVVFDRSEVRVPALDGQLPRSYVLRFRSLASLYEVGGPVDHLCQTSFQSRLSSFLSDQQLDAAVRAWPRVARDLPLTGLRGVLPPSLQQTEMTVTCLD